MPRRSAGACSHPCLYADTVKPGAAEAWICPTCGDPLKFEILDDERFLVAWSCVTCGLIRTTEPI